MILLTNINKILKVWKRLILGGCTRENMKDVTCEWVLKYSYDMHKKIKIGSESGWMNSENKALQMAKNSIERTKKGTIMRQRSGNIRWEFLVKLALCFSFDFALLSPSPINCNIHKTFNILKCKALL